MRRALIATLIAALCVTAGCATGGPGTSADGEPDDTTATPTATPEGTTDAPAGTGDGDATDDGTDTTTAATEPNASAIPGVEDGEVTDFDTLLEANGETLAGRDFVRVRTFEVDYLAGSTEPNTTQREVERHEAGEARVVRSRTANDSGAAPFVYESTLYADDEGTIFRDRNDEPDSGDYDYRRLSSETVGVRPALDTIDALRLDPFFGEGAYELDATCTAEGKRLYVFVATENGRYDIPNGDYRSEIVVDGRGQVQSVTTVVVVRNESSGVSYRLRYRYRLQRVGDVTVETPEWVQQRREGESESESESEEG